MEVRRWRFTWLASQRSTSRPFCLGRATTVVQADGTSVTNTYWLTGELRKVTGSRVYPVEYTYDTLGRMATMTTWRNFAGNSGAAVTTWLYDNRGRLQYKRYDDASEVFYQYTPGSRLKQRAWARYLYTTYEYDFEDTITARKTGDLVRVSYSDGVTPQVSYVYDRRGRRTGIEQRDGGSTLIGASTLGYDASGVLTSETHTTGPLSGLSLTLGYDSSLRRTNLTAKQSSTTVLLNRYGYDTASRLNLVGNGTSDVSYTYAANSFLADTVTSKQSGTTRLTTTRQYDFLNRLQSTWAQPGAAGTAPIGSAYQYNDANQRTRQQLGDASYWRYEYDALGQVTSGRRYWSDGTPVLGQQFEYGFDDIGNRKTAKTGGDLNGANLRSQNYTANNLNLYTAQTNPRYLEVQGAAQASATVTVNSASASRQGEYFRKELGPSSGTTAKWEPVTVSVSGGSTTGTKYLAVPPSTVSSGYDADGNLLSDGLWTYAWDGENRLIEAASALDPNTAAPYTPTSLARRITYRYDGVGRLIERVEYPWTAGAWSGTPSATTRYLNDGWQCVAEFSFSGSTLTHLRSYVWGLDLSGGTTGAGGVGGLVAIYQTGAAYFPAYDGNGNVAGLVKGSDGTVNGRYEYGPFGEPLRATGDAVAMANPWRFSSKRTDPTTGHGHYEYRVYSPSSGRWLSRDPIEENGGNNIHTFVANSPLNEVDSRGLSPCRNGQFEWIPHPLRDDLDLQSQQTIVINTTVRIGDNEDVARRPVSFGGMWGLTITEPALISGDCCCTESGAKPIFDLSMHSQIYILDRRSTLWNEDYIHSGDPNVDEYWHHSTSGHRRSLAKTHEGKHQAHGRKNYEKWKAALSAASSNFYSSRQECLSAVATIIFETWRDFQSNQAADAAALHSGG